MASMEPRKKIDRIGPSFLHPDWTESEVSLLIEIWRDLETRLAACRINPQELAGGIDKRISSLLAKQIITTRTPASVSSQRFLLYKAIRFISRFNEFQQESGGRGWFDLSMDEQDRVEIPTRERKACKLLTRESFNKLIRLKSVKKWTNTHNVALPKPKPAVASRESLSSSSCRSCWSTSEVRDLVRSWGLVMKKTNTFVSDFVTQAYDKTATLYTPWQHSTMSAWRKMKRIAASYLFIRDFNAQNSPAQWFQLSDGAQNSWIDWSALPADFEDIPQAIFDEISAMDASSYSASSTSVNIFSDDCSSSAASPEKLRTTSPHLPCPSPSNVKITTNRHQECNALYEYMEQLQKKQFKQGITRLRTDIERDIRLSADTVRGILFERLGDPGQNGDATFVANILEGQQRRIHERFAQFQWEKCSDGSDYAFGKSLKS